jgi:hypothetical protein
MAYGLVIGNRIRLGNPIKWLNQGPDSPRLRWGVFGKAKNFGHMHMDVWRILLGSAPAGFRYRRKNVDEISLYSRLRGKNVLLFSRLNQFRVEAAGWLSVALPGRRDLRPVGRRLTAPSYKGTFVFGRGFALVTRTLAVDSNEPGSG